MHVPMEQLKAATDSFLLHVPYTGAGPAIMGLLGAQVDALASGPASVAGQIKAGKMRALAHWGEGRLATMPDVPSFKELGVPIGYSQWSGIFVPAGTPPAVISKLRDAARAATQDARANQILTGAGTSFQYQDLGEFEKFVTNDARAMSATLQKIGKVN
jgi:tripartite-type tricarboxylate transporter receptor subunit TctC